jgi:hypothetical protein
MPFFTPCLQQKRQNNMSITPNFDAEGTEIGKGSLFGSKDESEAKNNS